MKFLYVTTISGSMVFFPEHIKTLIAEGHDVEFACNCNSNDKIPQFYKDAGIKIHNIPFSRSPLSKDNIIACKQLKKLLKTENYDVIHTHTPNASACVRLMGKKCRKSGTKIMYTAHGFHFFKGAPLKNWLLYYPVEWLCAHWTDVLITINHEDYDRAKKHMHAKQVEYVPGVGLDTEKIKNIVIDRKEKRQEISISEDAFLMISVGELNKNKNHEVIIRALAELNDSSIQYIIVGKGSNDTFLRNLAAELGVSEQVHLLGYRCDVIELCKASDVFCFPSRREGLGKASLEAMASGLPLVTSNVHGINDYSEDGVSGFKINPSDSHGFSQAIKKLIENSELRKTISKNNLEAVKKYNIQNVLVIMKKIYFGAL